MDLQFLAISDTHLGEDSSLLSYPQGCEHFWDELHKIFGDEIKVKELILIGDIPDRTLSSTAEIITFTNAFMRTVDTAITKIDKMVYVPGNHDHTIWTEYGGRKTGNNKFKGITPPEGDLLLNNGQIVVDKKISGEIFRLFLGYPHNYSWKDFLEKKLTFAIANPLYYQKFKDRHYIFTHGTLFKEIVCMPAWIKKIADYLEFDELLGKIELESDCDVSRAHTIDELEKECAPFVDSLWPSSKNNPTSQADQFWYLLTSLEGKFAQHRAIPHTSALFSFDQLTNGQGNGTICKLDAKSFNLINQVFWPKMKNYLKLGDNDLITFVFGDTHQGGFHFPSNDNHTRIYNTGSWVNYGQESHPTCHIFALDDQSEYLADISFKDAKVENDLLLEVAAAESEHRKDATSRILKGILRLIS